MKSFFFLRSLPKLDKKRLLNFGEDLFLPKLDERKPRRQGTQQKSLAGDCQNLCTSWWVGSENLRPNLLKLPNQVEIHQLVVVRAQPTFF